MPRTRPSKRERIDLMCVRDTCLGREVFRGSAPARVLVAASWIDFHDRDNNQFGYQRPIDPKRAQRAADYAGGTRGAFWPECILAIRSPGELDDPDESVTWKFAPSSEDGRYGRLSVEYNPRGEATIEGPRVPWRRAFAQVDCQHRFGALQGSDLPVTFCIFPDLSQRDEAVIFRTINDNQKKISTSLVSAILLVTDPNAPAHLKFAWNLDGDVGSSYHHKVWSGGRGRPTAGSLVNLSGLSQAIRILVPTAAVDELGADVVYTFVRNYWNVIRSLWPDDWVDKQNSKLQTNPGIRGLSRLGRVIFNDLQDSQNFTVSRIRRELPTARAHTVQWESSGPLGEFTGKGGERNVFEYLTWRLRGGARPRWLT